MNVPTFHSNDYAYFSLLQNMSQELGKWLSNQEEKELEKQICWSKPPPASLTSPPWRLPHTLLRASDVNKVCLHGHAVWYKLIRRFQCIQLGSLI